MQCKETAEQLLIQIKEHPISGVRANLIARYLLMHLHELKIGGDEAEFLMIVEYWLQGIIKKIHPCKNIESARECLNLVRSGVLDDLVAEGWQ